MTENELTAVRPDCLAPAEIAAKAEVVGQGKAGLKTAKCLVLSVMAGMFIAMGALFMTIVKSDASLGFAGQSVLGGVCFSLGLLCVVVAGAELFTGNMLMICAKASGKISWGQLAKNWALVWFGNLIGSLVVVGVIFMCGTSGLNGGAVGNAMVNIACAKIDLGWEVIFFRGIMCNVLVCLGVWMAFAGRTVIDKVFTCMLPVAAFVACGFEHCVANMYFLPMGMLTLGSGFNYTGTAAVDVLTLGGILWNISAATLGNIVGGALFVGLLYWFAYRKA